MQKEHLSQYTSLEGKIKRVTKRSGTVLMCAHGDKKEQYYELPVGAMFGLSTHRPPKEGDRVNLTLSGGKAVAARIKR